jgi:hypothetical protein
LALVGATTPAKRQLACVLSDALAARGASALVIGNRRGPDPELEPAALRSLDARELDDTILVTRLAEVSALRASPIVITIRPVLDELARYRAARSLRREYARHHITRRIEDRVADASIDYDFVLWSRSHSGNESERAFDAALGTVLLDLGVRQRTLEAPLAPGVIERVVASLCP